jgi:uncharacterized OB-fold protein
MTNDVLERPFTAAAFNQFIAEKKLMASRCARCAGLYLPPRAICPKCHSDQLRWEELSGHGTLAAFTSVYIAPTFMVEAGYGRSNPYVSAVVKLDEGVMISARILDVDPKDAASIAIDTPLTLAFIEQSDGEDAKIALAFKPVTSQ